MKRSSYLVLVAILILVSFVPAQGKQAPVLFEMRLAGDQPGTDLDEIPDSQGSKKFFMHKEIVVNNTMIKEARAVKGMLNEYGIRIALLEGPSKKFHEFTKANVGEKMAVLLDGKIVSISTIREPITGGECEFGNGYTRAEARRIAREILPPSAAARKVGPEDAARAYFEVLQDEGMAAVLDFIHPEALIKFRDTFMPLLRLEADAGKHRMVNALFGEAVVFRDVEAMPAKQFVGAFIKIAQSIPGLNPTFEDFEIIGTVREGEVAHVLARMQTGIGMVKVRRITVLSFKLDGNAWKPLLSAEIEGFAEVFGSLSRLDEPAADAAKHTQSAEEDVIAGFNDSLCEDGPGYDWLSASDEPVIKLEYRLAGDKNADGLTETVDPETGKPLYLYADVVVNNAMVRCARVVKNPVTEKPAVEIQLVKLRAAALEDFTAKNIGGSLAVLLDGKVVTAARITERITGGRLIISGNFSKEEAERIAAGIVDR